MEAAWLKGGARLRDGSSVYPVFYGGRVLLLLHVSPVRSERRILREGLDPEFSRSNRKMLWFIEEWRLPWLLNHLQQLRGWRRFSVYQVIVPDEELQRAPFGMAGVRVCSVRIRPEHIALAFRAEVCDGWSSDWGRESVAEYGG